jgi:hypothetical protein
LESIPGLLNVYTLGFRFISGVITNTQPASMTLLSAGLRYYKKISALGGEWQGGLSCLPVRGRRRLVMGVSILVLFLRSEKPGKKGKLAGE